MKKFLILAVTLPLLLSGCGDDGDGTADKNASFMFWCFREEMVSTDYHIPDMASSAAAAYIQNYLLQVPGYQKSSYDLDNRTMTITYAGSQVRKMNFEELIALTGFRVNNRPAKPNAQIPEGVK